MRRTFALRRGGTAGHADDAIDAEFGCKTNGVAQRAIMRVTNGGIGMQRIAPHVQCGDVQTARADLASKCRARRGIRQQARHVAMIGRCVGAGADLQAGDFRHVADQPVHDLGQAAVGSALPSRDRLPVKLLSWLGPLSLRCRETPARCRPGRARSRRAQGRVRSRCCASCKARPVRRSNSQPCQGQASIGVERSRSMPPGEAGGQTAAQNAGTYRAALMRAEIVDGIHRAVPADDADLAAVHTDGADRAIREFRRARRRRCSCDRHAGWAPADRPPSSRRSPARSQRTRAGASFREYGWRRSGSRRHPSADSRTNRPACGRHRSSSATA